MKEIQLGDEVFEALKQAWATLEPLGFPMAVMGGIAVSYWQHLRSTRDVDLLIQIDSGNFDQVLPALRKAGFQLRHDPPVLDLGDARIMQLLYTAPGRFLDIRVDLLFAESEYQKTAIARRVRVPLPRGVGEGWVLSCEDMILLKLLAGRIIDRADVVYLLRYNRQFLDFNYLGKWISKLKLDGQWTGVWAEAFPGEPSPISGPRS